MQLARLSVEMLATTAYTGSTCLPQGCSMTQLRTRRITPRQPPLSRLSSLLGRRCAASWRARRVSARSARWAAVMMFLLHCGGPGAAAVLQRDVGGRQTQYGLSYNAACCNWGPCMLLLHLDFAEATCSFCKTSVVA